MPACLRSRATVFGTRDVDRIQVTPGLERTVGLPMLPMDTANVPKQRGIRLRAWTGCTPEPVVIAAARDV